MQLFELQQHLKNTQEVYHITELHGKVFRLWETQKGLNAQDYDHRLSPSQFRGIIQKGLEHWPHPEAAVTVEYQGDTIEMYFLENTQGRLILQKTQTACLAPKACNLPEEKSKNTRAQCAPNSGCC